jgi:hypothetical protein
MSGHDQPCFPFSGERPGPGHSQRLTCLLVLQGLWSSGLSAALALGSPIFHRTSGPENLATGDRVRPLPCYIVKIAWLCVCHHPVPRCLDSSAPTFIFISNNRALVPSSHGTTLRSAEATVTSAQMLHPVYFYSLSLSQRNRVSVNIWWLITVT